MDITIAIQPLTDFGVSALNLTIYDDKTALQNLLAGISELNVNAQDLLKLGGVTMVPTYAGPGPAQRAIGNHQ